MAPLTVKDASGASISVAAANSPSGVRTPFYIPEGFVSTATIAVDSSARGVAYAIGDAIGATFEIQNIRKSDSALSRIQGVTMILNDVAIGTNAVDLLLFSASPNAAVDNTAYLPNYAAGAVNLIGKVTLSGGIIGSGAAHYRWNGDILCAPSATSIFGITVATSVFTFTTISERRITVLGQHA